MSGTRDLYLYAWPLVALAEGFHLVLKEKEGP